MIDNALSSDEMHVFINGQQGFAGKHDSNGRVDVNAQPPLWGCRGCRRLDVHGSSGSAWPERETNGMVFLWCLDKCKLHPQRLGCRINGINGIDELKVC